jgi:DegV family protein with EDD domain
MLRIVTDGGGDMPQDWPEKYHIDIIPIMIRFGEKIFTQGVDLDQTVFYQLVAQNHVIPKTSLPSPQQIVEFYRKVAQKGDDIISIHVSSRMSGTYSAIQLAAKELVGEFNIYPFDTLAGSAFQGLLCREVRLLHEKGWSVSAIMERLENLRKKLNIIFTIDTLDYAYLNGRVSYLQSAIASLLHIKPIIELHEGTLSMTEKIRTRKHAINRVLELIKSNVGSRPVYLAIVNAADPETAKSIADMARSIFNVKELIMTDLSIAVAANLGPGTVGIVAIPE